MSEKRERVSAALAGDSFEPVTLQGDGEELDPREAVSLANALRAELFISFHASEYGEPGPVVWYWDLHNLLGTTGVSFEPFESPGGWAHASLSSAPRALKIGRAMVESFKGAGVRVGGPFPAPLVALEGLNCPALAVSIGGFGTLAGANLVNNDATITRLAQAIAHTLRTELAQ